MKHDEEIVGICSIRKILQQASDFMTITELSAASGITAKACRRIICWMESNGEVVVDALGARGRKLVRLKTLLANNSRMRRAAEGLRKE